VRSRRSGGLPPASIECTAFHAVTTPAARLSTSGVVPERADATGGVSGSKRSFGSAGKVSRPQALANSIHWLLRPVSPVIRL
jgi:hypothetical protein